MAKILEIEHPEAGACLALVRLGLQHGYVIAREFSSDGEVGTVLTATRPVVYREIAALESSGLLASQDTKGTRGQAKKLLRLTSAGNKSLDAWINQPVSHIREIRGEFLVKVILRNRLELPLSPFISAQRDALSDVMASLRSSADTSVVHLWRKEQVRAVARFLDELEGRTPLAVDSAVHDAVVLSARNQLRGTVRSVQHGDILSSVKVEIEGGQVMTSTVTREATNALRLAPGSSITALCKATDVLLAVTGSVGPE
jgi:PadR family transcriptional regulator AphA